MTRTVWTTGIVSRIWLLLTVAASSGASAAGLSPEEIETGFDSIVATAVDDGWVDYAKLKEDPGPLDSWLRSVEAVPNIDVLKWTSDQAVAFYINAYNGHVLRIVRDRFPISGTIPTAPASSIQQIEGVWELPVRVAGRDLTLDRIEKEVLIGEYDAPRVHVALVCASVGCPPLGNSAYHGENLLGELNLVAQEFLRSPRGARLDMERKVLYLSPIFDWHEQDFRKFGTTNPLMREVFGERAPMIQFVASFLRDDERKFLRDAEFRVEFFEYDWTLNDVSNR